MHMRHGMEGRIQSVMNVTTVRDELVSTLEEAVRLQQRLADAARDDAVPVADLVAQVSVLERLDDRRDGLISELRRKASADIRADRTRPPIREVVLEVLEELRWPQNAKFVEEFLWAKRQLQLDSRAIAPLRRDERRAWERAPEAREAYIAPALNPDGSANPRWITKSSWPLTRRIVASPRTERLLDLQTIYSLAGRPGSADGYLRGPRGPVDALLERYAKEILGTDPPPVSTSADEIRAWRTGVREHVEHLIGEVRGEDEPVRKQIASQLADLPERDRIWGTDKDRQTAGRRTKRV
jgi:hypothetical protein